MGKPTGFLEIERHDRGYEKVAERVRNFREFTKPLEAGALKDQAARCMDCGIPFCHNGCPVNNMIPDWNNLVYREQVQDALIVLHSTNNFPEFTGRICPAPCEASCTLNIDDNPVTRSEEHTSELQSPSRRLSVPSSIAGGTRAGSYRCQPAIAPVRRSPSSAPAPPAWRARSNWRGPVIPSRCSRKPTALAGCCATAFPTSKWKSKIGRANV